MSVETSQESSDILAHLLPTPDRKEQNDHTLRKESPGQLTSPGLSVGQPLLSEGVQHELNPETDHTVPRGWPVFFFLSIFPNLILEKARGQGYIFLT